MGYLDRKCTIGKSDKIENNSFTEHYEDCHYLVIGFEVNHSSLTNPDYTVEDQAYEKTYLEDDELVVESRIHHVLTDAGHAFMYLVKNETATIFLSLGPISSDPERLEEYYQNNGIPSEQEIQHLIGNNLAAQLGYSAGRQISRLHGKGTPDYHIPERTFLFKMLISEKAYQQIYQQTEQVRKDILSQKENYSIFDNHTCAKVVRYDSIGNALPHLPWGRSSAFVGHIRAINPYAFYEQMKDFKNRYPYIKEYEVKEMKRKWNDFIISIRDQKEKEVRQDMIIQYGSPLK